MGKIVYDVFNSKKEVKFMKRKTLKKLLSVSLVSAMAVSMLAGCGNSGGGSSDDSGSGDGGGDGNVLKVAALKAETELDIWDKITKAFEEEKRMHCRAGAVLRAGSGPY